jgi:predicted Fe-Mo cluster-binding NifX family protein
MILACATDNGINFVPRHFGDAEKYYIYELNEGGYELLEIIFNTTEEEKEGIHADPNKASGIVGLLKKSRVQVVMTTVFGPNLKRIIKHFVPVIASSDTIKEGLELLTEEFARVNELVMKNSGDDYLNLREFLTSRG